MSLIPITTVYRCSFCGKTITVNAGNPPTSHTCTSEKTGLCQHLGTPSGESLVLSGCGGGEFALFDCHLFPYKKTLPFLQGKRLSRAEAAGHMGCENCSQYQPSPPKQLGK